MSSSSTLTAPCQYSMLLHTAFEIRECSASSCAISAHLTAPATVSTKREIAIASARACPGMAIFSMGKICIFAQSRTL